VSNRIASVKVANLLDHADIPHLEDTIRVARCNILTSNGEAAVIDCIEMTEECLDSQAGSHVPNRYTAVSGATNEEVSVRLEIQTVD